MRHAETLKQDWASLDKNNAYIRIESVRSTRIFSFLTKCSDENIIGMTEESRKLWAKQLKLHEDGISRHSGKTVYCQKMTVLLGDTERTKEEMEKIAECCLKVLFRNKASEHPYTGIIRKQGSAVFLDIYFSERPYYPEGKEFVVKQRADLYVNKKTGKVCKKEDSDAILVRTKGSVLRKEMAYFGDKEKVLQVPGKTFVKIINRVKRAYIKLWQKITNKYNYGIIIRRKNKKTGTKLQQKKKAIWNSKLKKLEEEIEWQVFAARQAGLEENQMQILRQKIRDRLTRVFETDQVVNYHHAKLVVSENKPIWKIHYNSCRGNPLL